MTKTETPLPPDIAKMSFEEALLELEKIVKQLEDGKAKLDESLVAYERGALLRRACEIKLSQAAARIEQVAAGEGGVGLTPFNA